ncbi:MAG: exopolyphosphatase [Rubricoccaceae bacterium]
MRVCAIDVGTNTVVSVVADVDNGELTILADEERFARLGQGVDASGRLAPEAMDRVLDRLAQAQATARQLNAEHTIIAATSASRDASNVGELQERVRRELGLDYRVISGVEEAALSFRGALAMRPELATACVVDIGGGSTEIVAGTQAGGVTYRTSLDVGSVRLTERHIDSYPVSEDTSSRIVADVRAALRRIELAKVSGIPVVATGSVAQLLAGDDHQASQGEVAEWRQRVTSRTPEQVLALAPDRLAGRQDVVATSVLILETLLDAFGATGYLATQGALRHGLALQTAEAIGR